MKKETYTPPVLRKHGKVEAVTKGGTSGSSLDATFTAGSLVTDLTFS
ncbi:lasso RiPP family leader peptide-containing protein [Epibacterium ulvae]|nr:lasso RiPP family leader peptide-containing protein [Epibacterium ulvae]